MRPFRIVFAMFLGIRIQMSARGRESRSFALPHRVNMNPMLAWRQLRNVHFYFDAFFCGHDLGSADLLSLCVDDFCMRRFRRLPKYHSGAKQRWEENEYELGVRHWDLLKREVDAGPTLHTTRIHLLDAAALQWNARNPRRL